MHLRQAVGRRRAGEESGQSMVEYALVIVLVAAVTITVVWLLGAGVRDAFARLFAPSEAAVVDESTPVVEETTEPVVDEEPEDDLSDFFIELIDAFTGDDGLDWQTSKGNWLVKDGQFESAGQGALAWVPVPSADYTYSVDILTQKPGKKDSDQVTQAVVRYQDENNYYVIIPGSDGTVELAKKQNGTWYPNLATVNAGINPKATNNLSVMVSGSQIEVTVNGKLMIKYDDPNPITSGGAGAVNNGSSGTIDNVKIEPNP